MEYMEASKTIFGVAEQIRKMWEKIPKTKILNEETTINVPESVIDYTLAASIPKNFRSLRKIIEFSIPSIIRINVASLHPFPHTVKEAIRKFTYENGRTFYALFPEFLPHDCDLISISVSYKIDDVSLIDQLVHRNKAHEPGGPERNEYWMSAQLKHPKVLTTKFGRFDLKDVDVTVDVGIQSELKTTIPNEFIRRLKTFFKIMSETDPRLQFRAVPELRRLARSSTAGREFDIIAELESLFLPRTFSKYVDIRKDFHYSDCYKGSECYELPLQIVPKKMNVISRVDLSLEKPAGEGTLVYKNGEFIKALKQIFS
jgi:hypothetical protein